MELTCSRDLLHWERVGERELLIPVGEAGTWEAGMIFTVNRPLIVGDEIWIYYAGRHRSHGRHSEDWPEAQTPPGSAGGIGLAKLRLDGWVSADAGDEPGTLTTKTLKLGGDELVINADAQDGWVAVEILSPSGSRPLPGFGLSDCHRFSGDSVRHTVEWDSGADLSRLRGRSVRLRFHSKNASLYSFVFRQAG